MGGPPLRVFIGYDPREAVGTAVFEHSLRARSSQPVVVTRLGAEVCGTDGTNAFSLARFHVPRLCGYEGWALWMDGADMLMLADVAELWALRDERYAVQVVKHEYTPRHARKYVGTEMEAENAAYPCKNWSSVMLFNNELCAGMGMDIVDGPVAHRFGQFDHDEEIGSLPPEWNWLADENGQCHPTKAKVVHWTNGGPWFPYYAGAPFAELWRLEYRAMLGDALGDALAEAA